MLEEQFNKIITSYQITSPQKVAIALSGGIDSMALLKLMTNCNYQIIALTVNHNLRASSGREAAIVAELAQQLGVEHKILNWQEGKDLDANIEAIARQARYNLLTKYCLENDIKYLFTAHHIEDQAETVLMRLLRGSGVDGLSAMQEISFKNNINIVRPLLAIHKQELTNYLEQHNIDWVEDPTNQEDKFTRNKLRAILQGFPEQERILIIKRLSDTAFRMQRAKQALDNISAQHMKSCIIVKGNLHSIDRAYFIRIDEEIALRILAYLLCKISAQQYKPRFKKLYNCYLAIKNGQYGEHYLYGCNIKINSDIIYINSVENIKSHLE